MTVWITGAHGMLGRCIGGQLDAMGVEWIGTDKEIDIAEASQVERFIATKRPTRIFNCAAYTAVDAAESDAANAHRVNALGPGVLATACRTSGCDLVHFSTDYVFGGLGKEPYAEDAALAPGNVYGVTKAEGEAMVTHAFASPEPASSAKWWILRTSWLFGSGSSSFVDTMWNLMKSKEELRVVDDQVGRPTYVSDLARASLQLAGVNHEKQSAHSGVWHFANAGATSWYGLACEIRQGMLEFGEAVTVQRIVPVATSEFPRPASRPAYSVLNTERIEREATIVPRVWQDALREYLKQRSQSEQR